MRQLRTLVPLLLILGFTPSAFPDPQDSSPATLPPVTAYALDRAKVTLPSAFVTPLNLLILFFQRDQETTVNGWLPVVPPDAKPKVQTWLLPVSQRENGLYRWWQNASLRGTQAASLPRRYTVPLYVDKRAFLGGLQVSSEHDVVVLVTDRAGHVLWRADGPLTDGKKADLNNFIAKSTPH